MKKFLLILFCVGAGAMLFAQEQAAQEQDNGATPLGATDLSMVGAETAKQSLTEVSVDLFEREASWSANIASDDGITTIRLHPGSAAGKDPLPAASENSEDTRALGVKVNFFKRGRNPIFVKAVRPIAVEGTVKTVSCWVAGRNFGHKLSLVIQDIRGKTFEISMGKLNFSGWRKLTATIPASPDGKTGVVQSNSHYPDRSGIRIVGFRIVCDPEDAFGTYYIYFDDMRAVTDVFEFESRDPSDMVDSW